MRILHVSWIYYLLLWTRDLAEGEEDTESSCDPAVRRYFGWCEQWHCRTNCSCTTNDECRQYCESASCRHMECRSGMTCTQSLHSTKRKPRAIQVQAESPFVTQDCSEGQCDNLVATRPEDSNSELKYFAFQNCVDGKCKNVSSYVEITKQFCGECDQMICSGEKALNCTQKCVVKNCQSMYCDARQCEQVCSHGSQCNMVCGPNSVDCVQMCLLGSTCSMQCNAKHCNYNCTEDSSCAISKPTTTTLPNSTKRASPRLIPSLKGTKNERVTPSSQLESNMVETKKPYVFHPVNNDNSIFQRGEYNSLSSSNPISKSLYVLAITVVLSIASNFCI